MDVAAWLLGLGLEQYTPAFRDNDVDGEVLPELTAGDLVSIGVTSVGHRRKLLAAIAALGTQRLTVAPSAASATSARTSPPISDAERRQLTVMFCDLVGSTALSTRFDPEDLRELIGDYHRAVSETVGRFDGFVAKYMGDGVLVYFGYPRAHEHDAERAVRAGLAVIEAVGKLPAREDLSVRLGIATGLAVVGDLIGEGAAQERGVVGETPNLAARLQALAAPNTLIIGEATRRQVGGLFDLTDLGPQALAGFAEPQLAWRVLVESGMLSRFEALRSGTTPLVGRAEELDLLLRRWQQAKAGEGRVVLVSGEPGIGKSRLTAALLQCIESEPHTRLRYFCSPYHQDSALYPFILQLERAGGFARDDTVEQKVEKLRALLAPGARNGHEMALFAELLSLPNSAIDLNLGPQRKREMLFEALLHQLTVLARSRPVLMVFEDVHWIDPTTRELLDLTLDRAARLPVLVVVTFRPEFQQGWSGQPHVTTLALNRLGGHDGAALVERLAGNAGLAQETIAEIVERADGVPLFVEELTKAVLESDERDNRVAAVLGASPSPARAIPATLYASLLARLDRLGAAAKRVAQVGASIGREFAYELLAIVAQGSEASLIAELRRLSDAGLMFCRGTPPDAIYTFKHALVQDAAHNTLLRRDRQRLHQRIAEAVEEHFPERTAREPELLAHHFAEAAQTERAIEYWLKAGERDIGRSANLEAIRHLTRGLDALRTLPDSAERDRRELAFQIAIGGPLIAVHGYSAPQTGTAYKQARELCERLGEVEPLVATLSGEFVYYFVRGDYPMMCRLTHEAQQVSRRVASPILQLAAHRLAGITAMHFGDFPQARSEFQAILRMYDASQHRSKPGYYVHDPEVSALTYLAPVLWLLGFPDQARLSSSAAFRCAAELDQANLTAHVHNFAGAGLAELVGDVSAVRAHADAMIELADRHSLGYWRVNGLILRGWAMVQDGATESGIELMVSNVLDRAALNVGWYQARYLCMLAESYAQSNQAVPGLAMIREAEALAARNDEHMWKAELDRVEGELLEAQGAPAADIEACFVRAIQKAREQSAKSLELRAAVSLARLWSEQGRSAEARDLLAPVYGWFTEGFDTADLKEAKRLLDELT
jgi:predicted ATPase/class 3 adenylate cyclase